MNNEKRTVLVLGDTFKPERLEQFLTERKWTRIAHDVHGEGGKQVIEDVWSSPDKTQAVHYVDDKTMLTRYLTVRAADVMPLASALVGHFYVHPPDELIQDVADASSEKALVAALYRLAVGMHPSYDDASFETFRHFSKDPLPAVRYAVIQSLLFTGWEQNAEILDEIAASDEVRDLREYAATAAAAVRSGEAGP